LGRVEFDYKKKKKLDHLCSKIILFAPETTGFCKINKKNQGSEKSLVSTLTIKPKIYEKNPEKNYYCLTLIKLFINPFD
jgi:hypothetical protein